MVAYEFLDLTSPIKKYNIGIPKYCKMDFIEDKITTLHDKLPDLSLQEPQPLMVCLDKSTTFSGKHKIDVIVPCDN